MSLPEAGLLEDVLTIQLTVTDLKPTGFTIHFVMLKDGERAIEGELVRRCVLQSRDGTVELPRKLYNILQEIAGGGGEEENRTA